MALSLLDALSAPPPCECACHATLSPEQRTQGVAALYRLDDALRGWKYVPIYEMGADRLFREAQDRDERGYRGIAVRDHACVYRRLIGFMVHEAIHALVGDPSQPIHGIPFGLPYGVPLTVSPVEEAAFLAPFNQQEARAFVGVAPLAFALFGIDWAVYTARDVGTYAFTGGRSLVDDVPPGYRVYPHVDRQNEPARYYALARRLEDEARAWVAGALDDLCARFEAAEAAGRGRTRPDPALLAARPPRMPGRNDPCPCGSGAKYKRCCG
jgi:hypothetical protein